MGSSTQKIDAVAILDVCWITAASKVPEFSMPITYFDAVFLKNPTLEMLFFYQLIDPTATHLNSVIVPCLKYSLSLTLTHFSPLAGRLTWPSHDLIPSVIYKPNDSVLLTIAESNNPESFIHHAGNKPCKATESRFCVPELHATDTESAIVSVQLTLFPNHGLAIGFSIHHAVLDGKSVSLFLKAWARLELYQVFIDRLPPPSPPRRGEVHFGVAGSPRLEVYQIDFGWGKPVKMEFTSIDGIGDTSIVERSDGSGGLEIGVVMTEGEMELFDSLFVCGLKHMSG